MAQKHHDVDMTLISGYLRRYVEDIPQEIIRSCFSWYHIPIVVLQFSDEYKTCMENELILLDDRKYVKRNWTGYGSILCDTQPVQKGVHCWRIKVTNNVHHFLLFGVSIVKKYPRCFSEDDTIWGIMTRNKWFPLKDEKKRTNEISLDHFNANANCEVDMLLNCDEGTLSFCIVGNDDKNKEARLWGMPKLKWVPHFNIPGQAGLQIAQIPTQWYGIHKDIESIWSELIKPNKSSDHNHSELNKRFKMLYL
eukprot:496950_1